MKNDFGDLSDSDKSALFGGNSDNNGERRHLRKRLSICKATELTRSGRLYLRMINKQFRKYMTVVC